MDDSAVFIVSERFTVTVGGELSPRNTKVWIIAPDADGNLFAAFTCPTIIRYALHHEIARNPVIAAFRGFSA